MFALSFCETGASKPGLFSYLDGPVLQERFSTPSELTSLVARKYSQMRPTARPAIPALHQSCKRKHPGDSCRRRNCQATSVWRLRSSLYAALLSWNFVSMLVTPLLTASSVSRISETICLFSSRSPGRTWPRMFSACRVIRSTR